MLFNLLIGRCSQSDTAWRAVSLKQMSSVPEMETVWLGKTAGPAFWTVRWSENSGLCQGWFKAPLLKFIDY
jgi:hypothetical protein